MADTINHGRIGYCIYCGSTGPTLSREHIVPLSLGGNHVLGKASCPSCACITRDFEHTCARTIFGPYRVRGDFPTRHPNERPEHLNLKLIDEDGTSHEIKLAPDEHPATLIMPIFHELQLLIGGNGSRPEGYGMWFALPNNEVFDLVQQHQAFAMRLGSFEFLSFCRLLAKISHAAAFMDITWTDKFEPLLPDLILGNRNDFTEFVGGIYQKQNEREDAAFPIFSNPLTLATYDTLFPSSVFSPIKEAPSTELLLAKDV